jgi:hypothetical protein
MLGVWVPVGLEARSWGFDVTFLMSFGFFGCSSFFSFFLFFFCFLFSSSSFVLVSFLYTSCMLRGAFTLF